MEISLLAVVIGVVGVGAASAVQAETTGTHKMVSPQEITWGPGPAALPPGAESAVLYGDPTKDALFAMRLKLPEVVTVISGTFRLGMGETADPSKAKALPTGSFSATAPGTAHYVFTDEDTIVQVNTTGPWGINYINPKDDPRQKSQ